MSKRKDEAKAEGVPSTDDIMKRIAKLEEKNAELGLKLSEAEKKNMTLEAAVNEQMATSADQFVIMGRQIQPIPLGKRKVPSKRYVHKTKTYVDEEIELEFFRYMIDMPAVGGLDLKIGGNQYVHGETYDLDINTLRCVQEQVARLWFHEAQIQGNNEAAWGRRKVNTTLSMKTGRVAHG